MFELPVWVPAGLSAVFGWLWFLTQRRLSAFEPLPEPEPDRPLPSVCLCIPARNEAREVGAALDAWLASDFPDLRILVIDDGSTDGTTEILAERAVRHPGRLRVIRNETLPPGWLGKNHALDLAARQPEARSAEWLLFVDADVQASPDLLRRSFALLPRAPFDVLALVPALDLVGFGERLFLPAFFILILWAIPPRRVADPASRFYAGAGAFMLVRREAYDAMGGHAAAPLEPIDDMMLARRLKRAGYRNRVLRGGPDLHLRPAHGLLQMLRGARKNALGMPGLWVLAPLLIVLALLVSTCPLWLALGGWPAWGFILWLLWPPLVGGALQAFSRKGLDWILAFWPLFGPIAAVAIAWALWDKARGVNHWRGRNVAVR